MSKIIEYLEEESIIHIDYWRPKDLERAGYYHMTVNHKYYSVDCKIFRDCGAK